MEVRIKIADECGTVLVSRSAGRLLQSRIARILNSAKSDQVVLDFEHVESVSVSFADEALGKLPAWLDDSTAMGRIEIANTNRGSFTAIHLALGGKTRAPR